MLLNLLKMIDQILVNFYEKCYDNWWKLMKKHTTTDEKRKEKWFYWLRVDLMKIEKIGLKLMKNVHVDLKEKKVDHDHVI